ncbi:related to nuclear pore protein NUP57 [Rhynchosporium graminicola]|uniref:Related to nuclear pore protein NUP57 n=1 Tax=Rhynchosporium graminicola TaxID=2792576 RepID=A0A1E1K0G8_9HELO|nr:related to nuclear pore protein NUP57 [Rhynchosporium commune]
MFGASKPVGGGLFGSSVNTNTQQASGGLFGSSLATNNHQNQQHQGGGGLFSSLGQSTQQNQNQNQNQTSGGLFGNLGQSTQNQQQQGGGMFGNMAQTQQSQGFGGQQNQPQQTGGLFGQSQNSQQQQPSGGLFGGGLGQNQQQQQPSSQFGSVLGQSQNQQQQQQSGFTGGLGRSQTNQQQQNSLFSQSSQPALPQLGQSGALWQANNGVNPREKSIPDQMQTVLEKWDSGNPNCVFKHYFYNKVDDNMAPYYRPSPNEDPKAWEEALSNKPGPGYIPVLCVGFQQMGDRIKLQQRNLSNFNVRLHEINASLSKMMQEHETRTSIRTIDARRKHVVLKQRCLALAGRVQVLRNRGYAMAGDEEDLRTKLLALEKNVTDPGLGARGEEIWARMLIVQDRARTLRNEIEKAGAEATDVLDEETSSQAKKVLEDYNTQLSHLKGELESINKEFLEWQKEQGGTTALKAKETVKIDTQARRLQFV